jgi:tRNA 2-thiocytidine biosynthesis protein TtcA
MTVTAEQRDDGEPRRFRQVRAHLLRSAARAIGDFRMIGAGDVVLVCGDVVLVCVSGGKDSHSLLSLLLTLRARAPFDFRIVAMNLDQKQPGFPAEVLPAYFERLGVEHRIVEADTYSIVRSKIPEGRTTCSLCSRLRRGIIYRTALEVGATRIALGHHRDDLVETLFLNMFFGGRMKSMAPRLRSDDGRHVVIRPLAYCSERDLAAYARYMRFPIIPCDLCGSQPNLQRKRIKAMLQQWEREQPGRVENVFRALTRVVPSHLADRELFDFVEAGDATPLDTLFDPDRDPGGDPDAAPDAGGGVRPLETIRVVGTSPGGAAAGEARGSDGGERLLEVGP